MPAIGLVLALLAAVAALAAIGRRFAVPDPIVFALGGLALALVPGLPRVALPPSLVLVVFLPPLIFAAAQALRDRLLDLERSELQRLQNAAVIDGLMARRLQRNLDLLRLRDGG